MLLTGLRRRAGDLLRSVVHYDESEFDIMYLRDDVAERYNEAEIGHVVEDLRWSSLGKDHQEKLYVHGRLRWTARVFDDAVEVHIPHDELSGTAVAFDHDALSELDSLIGSCLDNLLVVNDEQRSAGNHH